MESVRRTIITLESDSRDPLVYIPISRCMACIEDDRSFGLSKLPCLSCNEETTVLFSPQDWSVLSGHVIVHDRFLKISGLPGCCVTFISLFEE